MPRFSVLLALLLPASAIAVPMELTHQGRLFDLAGLPLDGAHDLTITLYDDASAGAQLWTDDYAAADFSDGYYTVRIGSGAALDATVFDGDDAWLELTVDGSVLATRLPVVSVPYAIRASSADTATDLSGGLVDATEIRINGTTVIDSSGNLAAGAGDGDTLAALGCASGDIAQFDGLDWQCAAAPLAHTHDGSEIDSGVLDIARLPVGGSATDVSPGDHVHGFGQITGQVAVGQLPVGTGSSEVSAGNHGHAPADSDTLDGLDSTDFADIGHAHVPGDATTLDGLDSLDFADVGHGHVPGDAATLDGLDSLDFAGAGHAHSVAFSDLTGSAVIGQLPVGSTASDVSAGDHTHTVDYSTVSGTWREGMTIHYDANDSNSYSTSAPTVWNDLSGTGVRATVGPSTTYAALGGFNTLVFAGNANSYAQFDNRLVLDAGVMTGVMWVYNQNPDSGDFGGLYVNRNDNVWNSANWVWFGEWAGDTWYFRVDNGGCCQDLPGSGVPEFSTVVPNDEWHMVHFAYHVGGTWKWGADGVNHVSGRLPGKIYPFVQEETTSTIGYGHGGSGGHWQGGIAEVMFWDRVVTDAEILDLFNATKGKYGL